MKKHQLLLGICSLFIFTSCGSTYLTLNLDAPTGKNAHFFQTSDLILEYKPEFIHHESGMTIVPARISNTGLDSLILGKSTLFLTEGKSLDFLRNDQIMNKVSSSPGIFLSVISSLSFLFLAESDETNGESYLALSAISGGFFLASTIGTQISNNQSYQKIDETNLREKVIAPGESISGAFYVDGEIEGEIKILSLDNY
jgi:hypothetical protein